VKKKANIILYCLRDVMTMETIGCMVCVCGISDGDGGWK